MRPRADLHRHRHAFSLVEMLVALAILVAAFAIIWGSFTAVLGAWRRGTALLESLHHGDYVMEQLASSLRSAAYFPSAPSRYGFRLEHREGGAQARDMISWVASGTAFIPPGSPLENSLYRLEVTVEETPDGEPGVSVRAYPYLSEKGGEDVEPWFVTTRVRGLRCRVYNEEKEEWEEDWEDTNSVPAQVEITLYLDQEDPPGESLTLLRLVEMPVAEAARRVNVAVPPPSAAPTNQPVRMIPGQPNQPGQPSQPGQPARISRPVPPRMSPR